MNVCTKCHERPRVSPDATHCQRCLERVGSRVRSKRYSATKAYTANKRWINAVEHVR